MDFCVFMKKMNFAKILLTGMALVALGFSAPVFAEEAGSEWDGLIADPVVEKKEEPTPVPAAEEKKAETPAKKTTTKKVVKKKAASNPTPTDLENSAEDPDISEFNVDTIEISEDDDIFAETATESVEVPETAKPADNSAKIRIMAAVCSGIVAFGGLFIYLGYRLLRYYQVERFFK